MLIPSSVLAIHRVCAADTIRFPGIVGVRFEREPDGGCLAVATDTKRLLVCRWREPEDLPTFPEPGARVPQFGLTVRAEVARLMEREARKLKVGPDRGWLLLNESAAPDCDLTLAIPPRSRLVGRSALTVTCPPVDGLLAPWREVAAGMDAKANDPDRPLCLDPELLSGLIRAAGRATGDPETFTIGFGPGSGKKIRLGRTSADKVVTVTGYMMPLAEEYRPGA